MQSIILVHSSFIITMQRLCISIEVCLFFLVSSSDFQLNLPTSLRDLYSTQFFKEFRKSIWSKIFIGIVDWVTCVLLTDSGIFIFLAIFFSNPFVGLSALFGIFPAWLVSLFDFAEILSFVSHSQILGSIIGMGLGFSFVNDGTPIYAGLFGYNTALIFPAVYCIFMNPVDYSSDFFFFFFSWYCVI
jgi:urea transporter